VSEEENQVVAEQQDNVTESKKEYDIEAILKENKELRDSVKSLADKKNELLNETKKAKQMKEQIANSKEEELESFKKEFENYKQAVRGDKLKANALRVSTELADGDNADILSEFVVRRLNEVADEHGSLSDYEVSEIKKEFASNQKYKSLLRGSKASGGNAAGGLNTKAASNEISRADFDKLNQYERGQFFKNGGKLK
jgi:uncharacterized protein (DUF3084 family)